MGKITRRISRRDGSTDDHRHRLPDGSYTGGMLMKPNKDQSAMHSHLFECNEDTVETDPMHNFGDHIHETSLGTSSGPMAVDKEPGDSWQKQESVLKA